LITKLAISGYRSIRDLRIELDQLNVVTGANGSGKSSLYRSLRLLADVAQGRVVQSLANEGGLSSTLWAGPESFSRAMKSGDQPVQGTRRKGPVSLRLGFSSEDYGFAIDIGLPIPSPSGLPTLFDRDPEIKAESMWVGQTLGRANEIASRVGPSVRVKDRNGAWKQAATNLAPSDTMMLRGSDPYDGIELLLMREQLREWRFYDHLRTDRDAPSRRPQIGTRTPVLAADGSDFCAALQTIIEIGDDHALTNAIEDAFPGSSIQIIERDGYFELEMRQQGLLRPLRASELSDGTLRYLLLLTAFLSPRLPRVMILNEPETSLHPDLLAPLGRLIAETSKRCQILVVTHSDTLASAISEEASCKSISLCKELGETVVTGSDAPAWSWPSR
jgi:predicted ATPase